MTSVIAWWTKNFSSSRNLRPTARQILPVRSMKPCGWYSPMATIRVSVGLSSWKETLPLMLPGILSGALLVLLTTIKELPATLMLRPTGFDTLATRLWTYTGGESYAAAAPFAALLVLVAAVPAWMMISRLLKEVR